MSGWTFGTSLYGDGLYGDSPLVGIDPPPFLYPGLLVEWAPTTQPTEALQAYEDITTRVREWAWAYGRNDELGQFEAGTGYVLLDNRDRHFDPSFDAGPWFGNIKPRRMFRLEVSWDSISYPVFTAYARGFPQEWPSAGWDGVVRVDLVGAEALMQGVDLVVGFTRPAEYSGARIAAVLDAVGIPATLREIDTGTVVVDAITVEQAGTSALDHAKTIAVQSEGGQLFAAKDGRLTFHDRHRRLNAASLHTFSDSGVGLRYDADFMTAWDETYLANYLRVEGYTDSEPGIAEDAGSQADYHIINKTSPTALTYLTDREALANYQKILYAQPQQRAPALGLQGARDPSNQWPVILPLEVSDRITIEQFADGSDPIVLTQNVEGISHKASPGGPWLTGVATSPADQSVYWELGVAGRSELGTTTLVAP